MTDVVASLHRFPVKSMLGEDLEVADLDERGILGDRAYALVDASDGSVVSAKHPRKWREALRCRASYVDKAAPGAPVAVTLPDGTEVRSDRAGADGVLSRFLGREVRLVGEVPAGAAYEAVWPELAGAPAEFLDSVAAPGEEEGGRLTRLPVGMATPQSFVDVAALHVLTSATLAALGGVDPLRFRPNVVVETAAEGFPENDWAPQELALGSVRASVLMPTMRCVMTTLAHGDLPPDREVLRAVSSLNRREIPGLGTWACAGAYAAVVQPGTVRVGDPVAVGAG